MKHIFRRTNKGVQSNEKFNDWLVKLELDLMKEFLTDEKVDTQKALVADQKVSSGETKLNWDIVAKKIT